MALLYFANNDSFATGAIRYTYRPATKEEDTNRIFLPVEIEGIKTEAVLDTGDPYVIINPNIASFAGYATEDALESKEMLIRGKRVTGYITRLTLTLRATKGDSLDVQATAFVPNDKKLWGDFPSFLGLAGFLERMHWAIDPTTDTFFFGVLD
jgi:hypothetical protein